MARTKERDAVIALELMLEIKNNFPKLMDFYKLAGLESIGKAEFYGVMRMDDSLAEHVRAVELGFNVAMQIREMSIEELLKRVQSIDSSSINDVQAEALRVVVRCTFI